MASGRNIPGWVLSLCFAMAVVAHGEPIPTIRGGELRGLINKHKGEVVVVNFWATWCPPCRTEFGDIVRIYDDYHSKRVHVIAVSMNDEDELDDIEKFLRNYKSSFPIYRATPVDETFYNRVAEKWSGEIPVTLIFDTAGNQAHFYRKPVTYSDLVKDVTALLPSAVQ